jgi:ADP-ribosylglycohydrolase
VGDDTDTTSAVAGAMLGAIYGEKCLPDNVEKIFGYAGEQHAHVTYEDMVKTIDELF